MDYFNKLLNFSSPSNTIEEDLIEIGNIKFKWDYNTREYVYVDPRPISDLPLPTQSLNENDPVWINSGKGITKRFVTQENGKWYITQVIHYVHKDDNRPSHCDTLCTNNALVFNSKKEWIGKLVYTDQSRSLIKLRDGTFEKQDTPLRSSTNYTTTIIEKDLREIGSSQFKWEHDSSEINYIDPIPFSDLPLPTQSLKENDPVWIISNKRCVTKRYVTQENGKWYITQVIHYISKDVFSPSSNDIEFTNNALVFNSKKEWIGKLVYTDQNRSLIKLRFPDGTFQLTEDEIFSKKRKAEFDQIMHNNKYAHEDDIKNYNLPRHYNESQKKMDFMCCILVENPIKNDGKYIDQHIHKMPMWILQFASNIHILELGCNYITYLPKEIGQLTQLKQLFLSTNKLILLPDEIGDLVYLEELNLSSNELIELPSTLGKLRNLKKINLCKNNLETFPNELENLINLEYLDADQNKLTIIPSGLFRKMSKLHTLNLSFNQLTTIPESIRNLKSLNLLFLSFNKLTYIPPEIGELSKVSHISLSDNMLTSIPSEMGRLKNLTILSVNNNELTSIPDSMHNMKLFSFLTYGNKLSEDDVDVEFEKYY